MYHNFLFLFVSNVISTIIQQIRVVPFMLNRWVGRIYSKVHSLIIRLLIEALRTI